MINVLRISAICIAIFVAQAASAATTFYFTGTPNSWVSQGQTTTLTPTTGLGWTFSLESSGQNGDIIGLSVNDFSTNPDFFSQTWWDFRIASSDFSPLAVGRFDGATRWPFNDPGEPGLNFSGDARGNNMLSGYFEIFELEFLPDGNIGSLAVDAQQFGENILTEYDWISLRFNSNIPITLEPHAAAVPLPASAAFLLTGLIGFRLLRLRRT